MTEPNRQREKRKVLHGQPLRLPESPPARLRVGLGIGVLKQLIDLGIGIPTHILPTPSNVRPGSGHGRIEELRGVPSCCRAPDKNQGKLRVVRPPKQFGEVQLLRANPYSNCRKVVHNLVDDHRGNLAVTQHQIVLGNRADFRKQPACLNGIVGKRRQAGVEAEYHRVNELAGDGAAAEIAPIHNLPPINANQQRPANPGIIQPRADRLRRRCWNHSQELYRQPRLLQHSHRRVPPHIPNFLIRQPCQHIDPAGRQKSQAVPQ